MKKILIIISLVFILSLTTTAGLAAGDNSLAQKLSGRVLLQVQQHGEAWYVNPLDLKRYYLGRPADAFSLMQQLGVGITNQNLNKIPVGLIAYNDQDNDNDGLTNRFELALGTDPDNSDSDSDGFADYTEIENNYNAIGTGTSPIDADFTLAQAGKIFLQTQRAGEAWYLNPLDQKRYYLGRPADAFLIMKTLSLGITNNSLSAIAPAALSKPPADPEPEPTPPPACPSCNNISADQAISSAASAIRSGDKALAQEYFSPDMQLSIAYTMDFLNDEGRLLLGNILSGAQLAESQADIKVYSAQVYWQDEKIPVNFRVKKQPDDTWLLLNL